MVRDFFGSDGMNKGRVLALDPGKRRVGVAISDPLRIATKPLCVIPYRGIAALVRSVKMLVRRHNVSVVVVGVPHRTDGKKGEMELFATRIVKALCQALPCKVDTICEFYTTKMAANLMDVPAKKGDLDMKAAQIILNDYLRKSRPQTDNDTKSAEE